MKKFDIRINKNKLPPSLITIDVPNEDIRFTDLMPSLYRLYDKIIEAELKENTNITCNKGCGKCCFQLVPLSIPEAFFLHQLLKSFSNKKRIKVEHRFAKIAGILQNAGLMEGLKDPRINRQIDIDYFNLKIECPFLEDGICDIYKYRPFVCREYYVTSDAVHCANLDTEQIEKVKLKRNMGALVAAFTARLHDLPPTPIPLVLFPGWIKENPHLEAQKWSGVWLFTKIIDCLISLNDEDFNIVLE